MAFAGCGPSLCSHHDIFFFPTDNSLICLTEGITTDRRPILWQLIYSVIILPSSHTLWLGYTHSVFKNIALNLRLLEAKLKTARHGTLSKYRLSEKNGMHVTPLTDKELKDNVSPISVSFVTLYACRCRLSIYYLVSVTIAGKLCRVCRWVEFSIFCQAWGLWKIKEPSKRVIQEVSVFML